MLSPGTYLVLHIKVVHLPVYSTAHKRQEGLELQQPETHTKTVFKIFLL